MALALSPFRRSFALRALEDSDCEIMAALHGEHFARSWTDDEFSALLLQDPVFGFLAVEEAARKRPAGFVLARNAAGEAEILTIAVSRPFRRKGIGRMLMDAVLRVLHADRAEALFLEVDEHNVAALGLYRRLGFHEVGRRPGYYENKVTGRSNALLMRRDLR